LFCASFLITSLFLLVISGDFLCYPSGTGYSNDCIKYSQNEISNELENEYGTKFFSCEEIISEKNLISNCENLSQTRLNYYYNHNGNAKYNNISGTCGIVATTNMVKYYENTDNDSDIETFFKIFEKAKDKGYTSINNGTIGSKMNNIVDISFNMYDSSKQGITKWYDVRSKVRNFVTGEDAKPVILSLRDHYVVVCGVTKYKITYSETYHYGWFNSKTGTRKAEKTIEYFIVNEGWGRKEKSLFYSGFVTNISNLNQVTYVK